MMIVTTPLKYDDDSGTAAAARRHANKAASSRRYAKYSMAARSDDKARFVVCDGGMQTLKDHARTKLLA